MTKSWCSNANLELGISLNMIVSPHRGNYILQHSLFCKGYTSVFPPLFLGISLATGGVVFHARSYPSSIHPITVLLLTKVLQKDAHFEMLPVLMGSEPAVSQVD